jgi:hypothetical protein
MKRLVIGLMVLAWSGLAQAYGLQYAVDSLEKAQAQGRKDASKHVLVFYTSPT